ncbi:MAG: MMPL family transporter [Deltaproteobacteria bacterium]|nr:MMPL family transporter [Deltaproteobacteria bacterium]
MRFSDAQQLSHNVPLIERALAEHFSGDDLRIEMTGFLKLMSDMERYIMDSQIKSFTIAFVVVSAMMMLLLRSVRLGLFAMIPNLMPILLGIAFMGTVGIKLDPGTIVIGCIALGLVVDDTVHFLVRLRRHLVEENRGVPDAIERTMDEAGRPIIITSVLLAGGFLTLVMGSFAPNIYFGVITGMIILIALVADLVVLPAALLVIKPKI